MDIASQQPPTEVTARLLLANDNAEGLLAMGTMFSPELAALDVQPDGKPVEINMPQMTGGFEPAYLAMTGDAVGAAIGDGSDASLEALLTASAGDPPPFMSMHLDGARYYGMIGDIVEAGASEPNPDGTARDMSPDMQRAVSQIMAGVSDLIERVSINVHFTDKGIEMPTTVTMAE